MACYDAGKLLKEKMKITETNYEEFYFGNACENFIQSEFYTLGYEALKTSPDIGYDLLVTNCARTKFLKEEPKQYNIQVKGRACSESKATFYIKKDDISMLMSDDNGILICVFCHPIFSDGRENIIEYRVPDPVIYTHMFEDFSRQLFNDTAYPSLKVLKEKNLSYVGFARDYIWFNNTHVRRLMNGGYFYEYEDNYCISFGIDEDIKYPIDQYGNRLLTSDLYENEGGYSYELSHINYMFSMTGDSMDGKMFKGEIYI
ncbi:hypothetical protein RZO55_21035 [Clostridium boliviensis]|uniref:DUF4365 domain-containing protein n=2 Tax=Clostridium boliviensis TaxID=318465 RepID=A0ABU4GR71_9CLOT|nr:hypothetical protein [Clostridium boliviensis]